MLEVPADQGFFKAYVMSCLLAFNPFMAKNFRPLGQKFLIQSGFLKNPIVFLWGQIGFVRI